MTTDKESTDPILDQALNAMDQKPLLTEEDIRQIMKDEDCMQVCQDMLECKRAVVTHYSRHTPDINKEWDKFRVRIHQRPKHYWMIIGGTLGVAASFLLILVFSWMKSTWFGNDVFLFQATSGLQNITLATTGGEVVTLGDHAANQTLQHLGATLNQGNTSQLVYSGKPSAAIRIEMHTLCTPRGKEFAVVLADSTRVWLNAESRLEYPSHFTGPNRVVRLQGEAYFEVAHDSLHPFIVETNDLQTQVLGTEFNVRNYSTDASHVTLITGSVAVKSNKPNSSPVYIKPGEQANMQPDGSFTLQNVDVDTYIYWKEGYFYFDDMPLSEIMQEIGRWYNVNIIFEDSKVMDYKLHFFCSRNDGLAYAVTLLQRTKKVEVWMDGNTVYVR